MPPKHAAEAVKVVVRCRPFNKREIDKQCTRIVDMDPSTGAVMLRNPAGGSKEPPKTFNFDFVYDWNSEQHAVYMDVGAPIIDSVMDGYNGTIFAYGQTGAGKTFSMDGKNDPPELRGLIPNSFFSIFEKIAQSEDRQFLVRVSCIEIYNEEIRDLLSKDPKNPMELKESVETGVYVKDLTSFVVKSVTEIDHVIAIGKRNRTVGGTLMNAESSRSHSIFTITIETSEKGVDGQNHIRAGKLNMVDLAGSERANKTGATGDRLKEGSKINLSLSALGNVISALVDGKSTHIPYRDSKLTRLLQDSLGGNTKTIMLAAISPADDNYDETLSTLRYANRAKNIQNKPKINEDPKDAMLRDLQEQIAKLKMELEKNGTPGGSGSGVGALDPEEQERRLREIQEAMDKESESILAEKEMADEERVRIEQELQRQREEAERIKKEKEETAQERMGMMQKLKLMQAHLISKATSGPPVDSEQLEEARRQAAAAAAEREEIKRLQEETMRAIEAARAATAAASKAPPQGGPSAAGPHQGGGHHHHHQHHGAHGAAQSMADEEEEEEGPPPPPPAPVVDLAAMEELERQKKELEKQKELLIKQQQEREAAEKHKKLTEEEKARAEVEKKKTEESLRKMQSELNTIGDEELKLKRAFAEYEEQRLTMEEQYATLEEEGKGLKTKIKKLWPKYEAAKTEIKDLQAEHQQEREEFLEDIRELTRQVKLKMLIIDSFVPLEELVKIEKRAVWDEENESWQIAHLQFAGNNMRAKRPTSSVGVRRPMASVKYDNVPRTDLEGERPDFDPSTMVEDGAFAAMEAMPNVYFSYNPQGDDEEKQKKKPARPQSGKRPGTAKKKKDTSGTSSSAEKTEESQFPTARGLISNTKRFA